MSSRAEEKQRRREEREAQERQDQAAAARTRRLQMVGGGILIAAVIAVVIVLVAGGGGGGKDSGPSAKTSGASIPAPGPNAKPDKLAAAAKAAGCTTKTYPSEGRDHTTSKVTYKTNPPTSGNHTPNPAEDGIYDAGNTPAKENFVHALEHGRIEIQYRAGTPKPTVDQLVTLFNEKVSGAAGYHTLLFQNNTNMPFAVAATGWTQLLGCKTMNPKVFDAIRAFRSRYVDKGPEFIP
jgi:hypothetical protein